jgi:hypothetical protein
LFVAATIARAVTDILNLMDAGHIHISIVVFVLYSLLCAHVIGYVVNFFVPFDHLLADYYVTIANDNASFAWSTTLTLIILSWLYTQEHASAAIAAWLVLIVFVCAIIYGSAYVQQVWLKPRHGVLQRLRTFESEAFALSIAYSVTVIIASSIYHNDSTNYLANTDDLNPIDDEGHRPKPQTWLFFGYLLTITTGMAVYQRMLIVRRKHRSRFGVSAQESNERSILETLPRETTAINCDSSGSSEYSDDSDDSEDVDPDADYDKNNADFKEGEDLNKRLIDEYAIQFTDGEEGSHRNNTDRSQSQPNHSSWLTRYLLPWDHNGHCRKTFTSFAHTFIGYLVSCGWTVWALLSFQNLFPFSGGQQFGLFLYALSATVLVSVMLTAITARSGIHEVMRHSAALQVLPGVLWLESLSTATISTANGKMEESEGRRGGEGSSPQQQLARSNAVVLLSFARCVVCFALLLLLLLLCCCFRYCFCLVNSLLPLLLLL